VFDLYDDTGVDDEEFPLYIGRASTPSVDRRSVDTGGGSRASSATRSYSLKIFIRYNWRQRLIQTNREFSGLYSHILLGGLTTAL